MSVAETKPNGHLWVVGMCGLLGLTIVVNIVMVTLAARSQVGYIEDKTWERDQLFQEQIDAVERFRALGLVPQLEIVSASKTQTDFELKFNSDRSVAVSPANAPDFAVTLTAKRGDDPSRDFSLQLVESGGGYRGHISERISGLWLIEITLERDGLRYRFDQRRLLAG